MHPSFLAARETANNLGEAFRKTRDENAIETILSQAIDTGNPEVLQNSIGKILSQVSPERQGPAIQYLQSAYKNVEAKKQQENKMRQEQLAAKQAGYTPGVPPQVAAAQIKENAKQRRLAQYGLGGDPRSQYNLPNAEFGTPPQLGGMRGQDESQPQQQMQQMPSQSVFSKLSDDQLVTLTGAPDREVSEPAKVELQRRKEDEKIAQQEKSNWTKFGMERAKKVLDKADEIAQSLPIKKTAQNMMKDAIASKDLSFWTKDNLAKITGLEGFISPEGAIFKTAGKEYFLGNIGRAGARPNMWIEQQISDMMPKIGRSTEANLSVDRALQNEIDLDEERVRLTEEIFNDLRSKGKDIGDIGSMVNKRLSKYAEQKQGELFNDLRAIKAIGESKPQKFNKVEKGSKISSYMVEALLNQFNNDPDKAMKEAIKLGYEIE